MRKFYITTPIYYVNDIPHIGHAYTTLAADVIARHMRMKGVDVFFLTGTDEHGQKVEEAARKQGISPKQHVSETHEAFKALWKRLNISNNDFIRTTDQRHINVVNKVLMNLHEKGEIYKDSYEGWYCLSDERFWTEKEIVAGKCPDCGRQVELIKESNYFFKMGKHRDWLTEYIKENPEFIQPETRRNEVLGFLKRPLSDLCISRPKERLPWGISLPFDNNFVTYVWFDALINYISAIGFEGTFNENNQEGFSKWWPANNHLVGKDILTTHSVYWPTMLHALGLPLPKNIFAHGWWTVNGEKMSKSKGNFVSPHDLIDSYGVDAVRYFLMREVPFGVDGDFSEKAIIARINSDLANNLGNLLSRTLNMTEKYFKSVVPEPVEVTETDSLLQEKGKQVIQEFAHLLESLAFSKALARIWKFVDETNRYIDSNAPWTLSKTEEGRLRLRSVLFNALDSLRLIARLVSPVMPQTGEEMLNQLGIEEEMNGKVVDLNLEKIKPGRKIKKGKHLFPRIEEDKKKMDNTKEQDKNEEIKNNSLIDIADFINIDLRVAEIKEAENIKKSKKLLKLKVDIGTETRQVVAGIAGSYTPEELIGKKIVLVSNLKPAKLMGVESQGMILAAETEDGTLALTGFNKDVKPGTRIK